RRGKGGPVSIVINNDEASDDLVWGCNAIAAVIRRSERSAFHLLENGFLPAKKVGGRWVASRRRLLDALTGDDGAASSHLLRLRLTVARARTFLCPRLNCWHRVIRDLPELRCGNVGMSAELSAVRSQRSAVSWPMARVFPVVSGERLPTWIRFSEAPSRPICRSNTQLYSTLP